MENAFKCFALLTAFCTIAVAGCSEIVPCDNQLDLSPAVRAFVNPEPVKRDFLANNRSHDVLVAVIDTGIDYNHPALLDSIHFTLDTHGQPLRLGWDFVGRDGWPCPHLGRSSVVSELELDFIDQLIREDHELNAYLDKKRNVVQEYVTSVWHGTSIAGLITKSSKHIGLLAYRVVPPNKSEYRDYDYAVTVVENLVNADKLAVNDGADIVVMTAFLHFDAQEDHRGFRRVSELKNELRELIRDHPNVLFLASAGNGNGYTFSEHESDRIDFPGGIAARNYLVVGSMDANGTMSSFSNIPSNGLNSVFLPGLDSASLYPHDMLSIPQEFLTTIPALLNDFLEGNESYASIASYLRAFKNDQPVANVGTSFSAAYAANACAILWLHNPSYSPAEIIDALGDRLTTGQLASDR